MGALERPEPAPLALWRRRWLGIVAGLLVCVGLVDWWLEHKKETRFDPQIQHFSRALRRQPCPGQGPDLAREQVQPKSARPGR